MTELRKKVSILLVLLLVLTFAFPAQAFNLRVGPGKTSYQSGESVTVSADLGGAGGGFSWFFTGWDNNTVALDGDGSSVTFALPENDTGDIATAVVEAVYGGESGSIALTVEPFAPIVKPAGAPQAPLGAEGPLQIVELYPANGATDVSVNTAVYIRFNKPAHLENVWRYYFGDPDEDHIFLVSDSGMEPCILESNADGTVWSLAPGGASLQGGQTYEILSNMVIADAETGEEILHDAMDPYTYPPFPDWRFTTMEQGEAPVPHSITITDAPGRLQMGQTYPLRAVVKDSKGDVLDWPVDWEVTGVQNGKAAVDGNGILSGVAPGTLNLTAWPQGHPDIRSMGKWVEIRANFDRHLLGVWAVELTDREAFNSAAPMVGEDGAVYLNTGSSVRAYDSAGNKMEAFREITGLRSPALAKIGGREYLLGIQAKGEGDNQPLRYHMSAFDPATGRLEWQAQAVDYPLGRPVADAAGNIYAGCSSDGKVYAFSPDSDRCLWSTYVQYGNRNDAYGDRGTLITPGPDGLIYAAGLDRVTCLGSGGSVRWQYTVSRPGHSIPAGVELDSAGNVYFLQKIFQSADNEFNIYSLDSGGGERWRVDFTGSVVYNLFVDADDSLYVTVRDYAAGTEKLTRLDPADGRVAKAFDYHGCGRFMRNGDGYIYTNKYIFSDNLEPVGYTDLEAAGYADDHYRDLADMAYSNLALCPDGALVRSVKGGNFAAVLEKVTLVDTAGAVPVEIEVGESELTLIQGGARDIFTRVKDSRGYLIPHQPLTYQVADPAVAAVDEAGRITALSPGTTGITVKAEGYEHVSAAITLHVLALSEVAEVYFVPQHGASSAGVDLEEKIDSITGVVGEERVVQLVVRDQHGHVLRDLPIIWTLGSSDEDKDGVEVGMNNYSGGEMGGISKSIAVLNGLKEGSTTLKAELEGYPEFIAVLRVDIEPAPYEILWTLPLEGSWEQKIAYHTQSADGALFIANQKKLKAVNSGTGDILWERDIADQYGFMPAVPAADGGNVYVYDISGLNLSLAAVGQADGGPRWTFHGGLGAVKQVLAGSGGVYLLAGNGRLYGLDRMDGSSLWDGPLSPGSGSGEASLGLSAAGELYYARGNQLYRVNRDGGAELLYQAASGSLIIEEVTAAGSIILERAAAGSYSILSVSPEGTLNWEKAVKTRVELSSAGGVIYAVTRENKNPMIYFIREDGTVQAELALATPSTASEIHSEGRTRPLPGPGGIVYIPLNCLYAVNAADGQLLWTGEFKDGWFKRVPRTATVDEGGVVYLACNDAGFIALKSRLAGVADESGFYIDTAGVGSLGENTYRTLSFRVRNDNETDREIRVVTALEDTGGRVLGYAVTADRLAAGQEKAYSHGLHIPAGGNCRVGIKLLDRTGNQILTEKILPVGR